MGLQKDYQYMLTGVIVVVAVYLDVKSKTSKN